MLPLASLWLPIVVATVLVFVASALFWMVGPHHKNDVRLLPAEAAMADVLRAENLKPGVYRLPWAKGAESRSSDFLERLRKGPVAMITAIRPGPFNMGRAMALTVLWFLGISTLVGFIAARTMGVMTPSREVFWVTAVAAFVAHVGAEGTNAIWWGKPWSHIAKQSFDAAVYGAITGASFCWLWPS